MNLQVEVLSQASNYQLIAGLGHRTLHTYQQDTVGFYILQWPSIWQQIVSHSSQVGLQECLASMKTTATEILGYACHSSNIHKDTVFKILRSGMSPSETSQTIAHSL